MYFLIFSLFGQWKLLQLMMASVISKFSLRVFVLLCEVDNANNSGLELLI